MYSFHIFLTGLSHVIDFLSYVQVLSKYPIMQIIDTLCVTLKSLDYADPKTKRVINKKGKKK